MSPLVCGLCLVALRGRRMHAVVVRTRKGETEMWPPHLPVVAMWLFTTVRTMRLVLA